MQKKISVLLDLEELTIHLKSTATRRLMLLGGVKDEKELAKFIRSVRPDKESAVKRVGATWGGTNVQVVLPCGVSFYAIQICAGDLLWDIFVKLALGANYTVGEVRDQKISIYGYESDEMISLSMCAGVLRNVCIR